jgi:hypothetical protein
MTETQRWLGDYAQHGSEAAFRELVAQYLDLVHSTAIRLVGHDTHLAEDVAQIVFMDLPRQAKTLSCAMPFAAASKRTTASTTSAFVAQRIYETQSKNSISQLFHPHSGELCDTIVPSRCATFLLRQGGDAGSIY